MLYGFVSGCFSVREIETSLKVNSKRLYHAGLKQVKRSTFCDAMEKRRNDIFRSVFHSATEKALKLGIQTKRKFKDPFQIIDASILPVCLSRFNWAHYRKTKGAVKLHLNLSGDTHLPLEAYLTVGKVHEVNQMENLCAQSGVLYVMDRGYVDYKSLYNIELRGSLFVTRMKRNGGYKRIKNNVHEKDGPVLSDVCIVLTGPATKTKYPGALRKIKYQDPRTGKVYEFLTNDMERDALEVAMLYKERWEIELFFKWIKQHLRIQSFWGTSMNAVYSQLWVALIVTVLLWINKTLNGITVSTYELLVMMKSTLLTKNTMIGLCTNSSPPMVPDDSCQPLLEGFTC
jgi:hypothetical protein